MATQPQKAKFLEIAFDVREIILKDVLGRRLYGGRHSSSSGLRFQQGTLEDSSAVLRACTQLRDEAATLPFKNNTAAFETLGELGAALLNGPATLKWWKSIRIEMPGRFERLRIGMDPEWKLERGLEMIAHVPNLTRLVLDDASLEVSSDMHFTSDGLTPRRRPGMGGNPLARPRMVLDLGSRYPVTQLRAEENKLERQVEKAIQQIFDVLPMDHATLERVELCGDLVQRVNHTWSGRREIMGTFRESWRKDDEGKWKLWKSFMEPVVTNASNDEERTRRTSRWRVCDGSS